MKSFVTILKILIVIEFIIGTFLWFLVLPGTDDGLDYFYKSISSEKKTKSVCEIEGKKIQQENEMLYPGWLYRYFNGGRCFHIESSLFFTDSTKTNEYGKILEFQSPLICNPHDFPSKIVFAKDLDKFIIYYTKEPQDGMTIIHNPFSKEIEFKQVPESDLKKIDNKLCGFGI